jgi:ribose transport system permease protein
VIDQRKQVDSTKAAGNIFSRIAKHFYWRDYVIYITFIVIFATFSITLQKYGFLSGANLFNIFRQTATISVMAVAMTFILSTAEIDLSVGAAAGLASVVAAMVIQSYGVIPGIIAGLVVGLLIGAINGFFVTRVGIPSFLVTLGMQGIVTGVGMWITNTAPIPIGSDTYNNIFGSGDLFGVIPSLAIWTLVVFVIGYITLKSTPFGRQSLATGGNETAARYSGIDTKRIKLYTFILMGVVAAIAGMLYAGRLHSGRYQWGQGDELSVIAAVVLGGTSMMGGSASMIGSLFGSVLMGMINNGLILMGLGNSQLMVVRGAIIIFAVALTGRKSQS